MKYKVNEIFYSIQGEGVRAGTANVFIRMSACNLDCKKKTHGFDCDTDFDTGQMLTATEIVTECHRQWPPGPSVSAKAVVITGGEPLLQVKDHGEGEEWRPDELIKTLKERGWYTAIETNGTQPVPRNIDWVCVSPKVLGDEGIPRVADEGKVVVDGGDRLPATNIFSANYLISPASNKKTLSDKDVQWCIMLILNNPRWRLSMQQHKIWRVR